MRIAFGFKAAAQAVAVAGLLVASQGAQAQSTTTAAIGVSATVGANCIVATVPIAFGVYNPTSATALNATGQVQLTCTIGATPAIAVDNGLNSTAGQRRLLSGATNFINYNVFQPASNAAAAACAFTTAYPTVAPGFVLTAAPSTAQRVYNVCGQIPALQSAAVGTYSDTITATVTF